MQQQQQQQQLLDMNEKTGRIERNAKREFMAHADTLLASEASLKKAITILREAIPDARRIATKVDFEVVVNYRVRSWKRLSNLK